MWAFILGHEQKQPWVKQRGAHWERPRSSHDLPQLSGEHTGSGRSGSNWMLFCDTIALQPVYSRGGGTNLLLSVVASAVWTDSVVCASTVVSVSDLGSAVVSVWVGGVSVGSSVDEDSVGSSVAVTVAGASGIPTFSVVLSLGAAGTVSEVWDGGTGAGEDSDSETVSEVWERGTVSGEVWNGGTVSEEGWEG